MFGSKRIKEFERRIGELERRHGAIVGRVCELERSVGSGLRCTIAGAKWPSGEVVATTATLTDTIKAMLDKQGLEVKREEAKTVVVEKEKT